MSVDLIKVQEYREAIGPTALSDDGILEVTFITEGLGSSGNYSRELLHEYGPASFGPGVLMFYNHVPFYDDISERDIKTAAAKILKSWYTEEDGVAKVKGNVQVVPGEREFIEFFADSIGASISIEGTGEYDAEGVFQVSSFNPTDPYRSVDFVVAAGRGGKIDKKIEAYKASENYDAAKLARLGESLNHKRTPTARVVREKKESENMSVELEKKIDSLVAVIESLVATQEAKAEAKATDEAVTEASKAAVETYASTVEAITEAKLLPSQTKALMQRATEGKVTAEDIAEAKTIAEEARAGAGTGEQSGERGYVREGSRTAVAHKFGFETK